MDDLDQHIQQCLDGRLDSFEVIVKAYEPKVRAVLATMVPDHGLIPDLVQEVFVIMVANTSCPIISPAPIFLPG